MGATDYGHVSSHPGRPDEPPQNTLADEDHQQDGRDDEEGASAGYAPIVSRASSLGDACDRPRRPHPPTAAGW